MHTPPFFYCAETKCWKVCTKENEMKISNERGGRQHINLEKEKKKERAANYELYHIYAWEWRCALQRHG